MPSWSQGMVMVGLLRVASLEFKHQGSFRRRAGRSPQASFSKKDTATSYATMTANNAKHARSAAAWETAIAACGHTPASSAASPQDLRATVSYLEALRDHLERRRGAWDRPPKRAPPAAPVPATSYRGDGSQQQQQQQRGNFEGPNPFGAFADDSDSSDDDDSASAASSDAGDEVVFGQNYNAAVERPMEMRRLIIRVLTTLSEVHSALASRMAAERPIPRWSDAAETYALGYGCATVALAVADERSARILHQTEHEQAHSSDEMADLAEDAYIVHVALTHFADCHDRYLALAERRAANLRRRLEPQWADRDEVRDRIGQERWENNPRPRNDYARRRRDNERELRELERAQEVLRELDVEAAVERSGTMMREIGGGGVASSGASTGRYNGLRPDYASAGGRVPFELYPDPTLFGWTFTGSSEASRVEFFERAAEDGSAGGDVVKLDFYYSTGTVKTSLHHPTAGRPTQLFGRAGDNASNGPQPAITPEQFVEVLRNPRAHTGGRYHTRSSGGGRGRGRGRRRGRGRGH